jgi:hypothetical protein
MLPLQKYKCSFAQMVFKTTLHNFSLQPNPFKRKAIHSEDKETNTGPIFSQLSLIHNGITYQEESVNKSHMDIKRKICDIRTLKKHLFLDIFVPSL